MINKLQRAPIGTSCTALWSSLFPVVLLQLANKNGIQNKNKKQKQKTKKNKKNFSQRYQTAAVTSIDGSSMFLNHNCIQSISAYRADHHKTCLPSFQSFYHS
jgi:hypothetical protein